MNEKTKKLQVANKDLEKHRNDLETLITERTAELIKAKEKAEKADSLKTAFLANMSHEIRTPMNAILGFIDLLDAPDLSIEESSEFKGLIHSSGNTLMCLIDDIIDLAKIESGDIKIKKTEFDLSAEIKSIYSIFSEQVSSQKNNILFIAQTNNSPFLIYSDQVRLRQIITNLLGNALKFTESGEIELSLQKISESKLLFSVRDTGIGIPSDKLKFVFDRFRKIEDSIDKVYRGAGLGLAISSELVKLLGGEIWVESKEADGSTFFFTISINK